jgi:hypothetical protein
MVRERGLRTPSHADSLADLDAPLAELGRLWAASPHRPRPDAAIVDGWDTLLRRWADCDLPLLLRSSGLRGQLANSASGRAVLFGDNTPAWWSLGLAMTGIVPDIAGWTLETVRERVPLDMMKRSTKFGRDLNKEGWKVCHIDGVSDGSRAKIVTLDDATVRARFLRFMSPRNMFLVPKTHSGMGELPEVIAAVRDYENAALGMSHNAAPATADEL